MQIIKNILYLVLILNTCISCHKNSDNTYFNGEIQTIEDSIKDVKKVTLKVVSLDGANFGWLSTYDSLMFFLNPKLTDRFYNIFNIDTGEEIGTFCNKGGGPDEVSTFGPIFHLFEEKGELKTLLFAPNEEKLFIWNITQSIQQGTTIMDKMFPYTWRTENGGAPYLLMFLQDKNTLIAELQSFPLNEEEATLPAYQKRTLDTNKLLGSYSSYKKSIKNGAASIFPESFFYSNDAFKPDKTKVVQAMANLPQLNILDIETGQVVGYRMKNGPDFSLFETDRQTKKYFTRVQADDNYIYTLYWGKEHWGRFEIPYMNTIYVFNWQGNLIRKLETDRGLDQMWIDPIRNRLYVTSPKVDDVFYLDLNGLFD